jgi:hypothetical protein
MARPETDGCAPYRSRAIDGSDLALVQLEQTATGPHHAFVTPVTMGSFPLGPRGV